MPHREFAPTTPVTIDGQQGSWAATGGERFGLPGKDSQGESNLGKHQVEVQTIVENPNNPEGLIKINKFVDRAAVNALRSVHREQNPAHEIPKRNQAERSGHPYFPSEPPTPDQVAKAARHGFDVKANWNKYHTRQI